MKKYNTVLILGAGASKPYGFPVADELLSQIKQSLIRNHEFHSSLLKGNYIASDMKKLSESLHKTQVDTIDEFLASPVCRNNNKYADITKYAIAYSLLAKENINLLQNPNDWYKKLYVKIFGSQEDNFTDDTAIITFNYDRSLDEYLCVTHAERHGISIEDARKSTLIKRIRIVHVHGRLASRGFGGSDDFNNIVKASSGIIINTNKNTLGLSTKIEEAKALINGAKSIYILGFGYHDENIKKIGLDKVNPRIQIIKGTSLNKTGIRHSYIKETIPGIQLSNSPINLFLEDEWLS